MLCSLYCPTDASMWMFTLCLHHADTSQATPEFQGVKALPAGKSRVAWLALAASVTPVSYHLQRGPLITHPQEQHQLTPLHGPPECSALHERLCCMWGDYHNAACKALLPMVLQVLHHRRESRESRQASQL